MKVSRKALALAILFAVPSAVSAAEVTLKEKCLGEVNTIVEMKLDEDTPGLGEKAEAEVSRLIAIAAHLCEIGNFTFASELTEIARGMLVSE